MEVDITNLIHTQTWLALHQLFDRHLGPDWPRRPSEAGFWEAIDGIDVGSCGKRTWR